MQSKILFIRSGSFSNINNSVYKILKNEFPDDQIDEVDIWNNISIKKSFLIYVKNIYYFFKEYGIQFLTGKKKINQLQVWFFATSYISIFISKKLHQLCEGKEYRFSLQTQSLFNGKVREIPNFVYTDHTNKANLSYQDSNPEQYIRSTDWITKCEQKLFNEAKLIFTFGSLVRNSLINQYNISGDKVITTYAGSNVFNNSSENIEKMFTKNILFVGVDWERKGGPILMDVFEKVLIKHPDATLTIVGCAPKGLKIQNCKIVGKIPVEEIWKYYSSASIFCMPTLREPFGVVFVEAMKYKLPIISNNIGALPDLVINDFNGYLVDNNIEGYAKAICKLLDTPEKCIKMGQNGYELAKEKFTWEKVGKTLKDNIEKSLNRLE